jgi:AbiV family abortive infection protein
MLSNAEQAQIQKSIRVILDNGDRLAEDARSLWEMDRFPSAFALCILSQEEYGKAFLLHFVSFRAIPWNEDVQRLLRDHTSKQLLALIMDFLDPDVEDFSAWLDVRREAGHKLPEYVEDALKIIHHEKVFRQRPSSWRGGVDPPSDPHARQVAKGELDTQKQAALYVGVGSDFQVTSNPSSVSSHAVEIELEKTTHLGRLLSRYDDSLQPLDTVEYRKIAYSFRLLFGLCTEEEYNRNWWA